MEVGSQVSGNDRA